jgi:hypothetical protein
MLGSAMLQRYCNLVFFGHSVLTPELSCTRNLDRGKVLLDLCLASSQSMYGSSENIVLQACMVRWDPNFMVIYCMKPLMDTMHDDMFHACLVIQQTTTDVPSRGLHLRQIWHGHSRSGAHRSSTSSKKGGADEESEFYSEICSISVDPVGSVLN